MNRYSIKIPEFLHPIDFKKLTAYLRFKPYFDFANTNVLDIFAFFLLAQEFAS